MTSNRDTSDRARVEVRPGVLLWLSGADLVAFRARQDTPDAPEAITSATVAAPENAALAVPKPRQSAPVKRATRKKV